MRLEINAGGITGMISVAALHNSVTGYIQVTDSVIDSFADIRESTCNLNGGVGDLSNALGYIEDRIAEETQKLEDEVDCANDIYSFLELAKYVDKSVSQEVRQNKEAFYQVNPWARPPATQPEDDTLWGVLKKGFNDLLEWGRDTERKIAKFASDAWEGLKDFIDENKEIIANAMRVVGVVILIAGAVLVAVFCAPVSLAAIVTGALITAAYSFVAYSMIGYADEVQEHGSDFGAYDNGRVLGYAGKEALKAGFEHFVAGSISKALSPATNALQAKALANKKIWSVNGALSRIGFSAAKEVVENLAARIVTNVGADLILEPFKRDGLHFVQDFFGAFALKDIAMDATVGTILGTISQGVLMKQSLDEFHNIQYQIALVDGFTDPETGAKLGADSQMLYSGSIQNEDGTVLRAGDVAAERARNTGKYTLEQTTEGGFFDQYFDNADVKNRLNGTDFGEYLNISKAESVYQVYPKEMADDIMRKLSVKFAQNATGMVEMIDFAENWDSIMWAYEVPNLSEEAFCIRISAFE